MINADRPVSDSTIGAFEHLDAAEEEVPRRSTFRRHFGKHESAKHLVAWQAAPQPGVARNELLEAARGTAFATTPFCS